MIKRIHVNQPALRANVKDDGDRPIFSIQTSRGVHHAHEVVIAGPTRAVAPGKALSCGARAWVETDSAVTVVRRVGRHELRYPIG